MEKNFRYPNAAEREVWIGTECPVCRAWNWTPSGYAVCCCWDCGGKHWVVEPEEPHPSELRECVGLEVWPQK